MTGTLLGELRICKVLLSTSKKSWVASSLPGPEDGNSRSKGCELWSFGVQGQEEQEVTPSPSGFVPSLETPSETHPKQCFSRFLGIPQSSRVDTHN